MNRQTQININRVRGFVIFGLAIPVGVIVVIIIAILVILGWYIFDYATSMDKVSISGPNTPIPMGQQGTFTVTVRYDDTASYTRIREIKVMEDDWLGNDLLKAVNVTVPANQNNGSIRVRLTCDSSGLKGDDGYSATEDPYHVYAMEDLTWPLSNVESKNWETKCVATEEEESSGEEGGGGNE